MQVLCWKTTKQASGGSNPSDKGGPSLPEGGIGVGGGSQKNVFLTLRASVWPKNKLLY